MEDLSKFEIGLIVVSLINGAMLAIFGDNGPNILFSIAIPIVYIFLALTAIFAAADVEHNAGAVILGILFTIGAILMFCYLKYVAEFFVKVWAIIAGAWFVSKVISHIDPFLLFLWSLFHDDDRW